MLLDALRDNQSYFKSTLLGVLQELKSENTELQIPASYKTIMRRERNRIPVYLDVIRDPTNGWRMYTGRQIRKIVEYELKNSKKKSSKT